MPSLTQKELMKKIVVCVDETEAIKLVSDAFSAEVLANRMGRLETVGKPLLPKKRTATDLTQLALERVWQICELTQP